MIRLTPIFIAIILFFCVVFSFFAILGGDNTSAPDSGFGKIEKGENINDVHCVMQSKNGEIYTLGYTCIQKFDKSGVFKAGAYFASNTIKHVINNEFLSLNEGCIVLLNRNENIIFIFNDSLNMVDKIEVSQSYDKENFYADYPNTDASDTEARLSFLNNNVILGNSKIKLDAPRNRWFSRDIGLILLFMSITTILILKTRGRFSCVDQNV